MRYSAPLGDILSKESTISWEEREMMDFNECVQKKDIECADPRFIFTIIPHFCGQDPMCIMPSAWSLGQAKKNAIESFDVVGYLEQYEQFVQVVEYIFPQYFKGALKVYRDISNNPSVQHKSNASTVISAKTRAVLMARKDIQLEYEFYNFIKRNFDNMYKNLSACLQE